jgi:superfamily II DNA or RNA helicase
LTQGYSEDWCSFLERSEWDLVVVDEAHRMSANWWAGELRKTRRYELGQQLGSVARHLLLMTATPHAGSEENFRRSSRCWTPTASRASTGRG